MSRVADAEVVWTPAARKRVHPRRDPGAAAAAGPLPEPDSLYASLARTWQEERAAWSRYEKHALPESARLIGAVRSEFERGPRRAGPLDPEVEAARAVVLGATRSGPFDEPARTLVGWWLRVAGPGPTVEILARSWRYAGPGADAPALLPRPDLGTSDPDGLGLWTALRVHLSACDEQEHTAAREAGARLRGEAEALYGKGALLLRCALSYLFPQETGWSEEDAAALAGLLVASYHRCERHLWCVLASLRDPGRAEALLRIPYQWGRIDEFAFTMVDGMGAAAGGPLRLTLETPGRLDKDGPCAEALALVRSPEVAAFFARRLDVKIVGAVGHQYLVGHPEIAIPALAEAACGGDKTVESAASLLAGLVGKHPEIALEAGGRLEGPPRAALDRARRVVGKAQERSPEASADEIPRALVASPRRRRMPPFWDAALLPRPVLREGSRALPLSVVENLGSRLAQSSLERPDEGLAAFRDACQAGSLAEFAWGLFELWLRAGAPAKDKWAFHALAHFGGDDAARRLVPLLPAWPGQGASARAALGIEVLGAIGTDVALFYVQQTAEKAKSAALRRRAQEALEKGAERRGLTVEDLADRTVPTLGLDADGTCRLDFGSRSFRAGFDPQLKPFVADEAGRRLARLPAPGGGDDREKSEDAQRRWKGIKADGEAVLRAQVKRLESAMCGRRRWSGPSFRALVAHPLLGLLARRLVWDARDREGGRFATFRVAEDGSFADARDEAFALPGHGVVVVPHPLEMKEEEIATWRRLLSDYEVVQPFAQLERPFFRPAREELDATASERVKGAPTTRNKVLALRHRGWKGGFAGVEGYALDLFKPVPGTGLHVALEVTGDLKLGAFHLRAGAWEGGEVVPFGRLDPITFSEIVRDVEATRA